MVCIPGFLMTAKKQSFLQFKLCIDTSTLLCNTTELRRCFELAQKAKRCDQHPTTFEPFPWAFKYTSVLHISFFTNDIEEKKKKSN